MRQSEKETERSERKRERWRKTQREHNSERERETKSDQHKITHTRFFSLFLAPKWTLTNRPESPAQQIRKSATSFNFYQFKFLLLESNYHAIRDLMSHTQTHTNVTHTHTHTHTH